MAATFFLRILTAQKVFFEGECESLIVPTNDGWMGILPHRADVIAALIAGELQYRLPQATDFVHVAIGAGMTMTERNTVTVLTEVAERAENIDFDRACSDYSQAKKMLNRHESKVADDMAQAKLARAVNRIKIKSKLKNPM